MTRTAPPTPVRCQPAHRRTRWHLHALAAPLLLAALSWPALGTAQTESPAARPLLVQGLPDFSNLVDKVGPAVVNISTVGSRKGSSEDEPTDPRDELLRRFFGVPEGHGNGPGPSEDRPKPRSVGSGFIIGADGYLLTNAHVVDKADEVRVRLADKREFKARVVGADKRSDVALLKIDAGGLPTLPLGDVNRLKVGEWVIAIGSPFDLDNSVTAGIVSAKGRETGDLLPFIQTDVAINPGNSGGPLINLRGEVVGINSQIYSRSGGYMGISFAIPIDEVARVSDQLRVAGRVVRGRIGVQVGEVTREVAESLGLPKVAGALVRAVEVDGPAAKAGISPGDVITDLSGHAVETWRDLPRIVGTLAPGSQGQVQVLREGKPTTLKVTVAELEPEKTTQASAKPATASTEPDAAERLGLSLAALSADDKRELKLDRGGVRITSAKGTAAKAGLREGDILISLANTEVRSVEQINALLAKADPKKSISVLLRRGEWAQYLVIPPRV